MSETLLDPHRPRPAAGAVPPRLGHHAGADGRADLRRGVREQPGDARVRDGRLLRGRVLRRPGRPTLQAARAAQALAAARLPHLQPAERPGRTRGGCHARRRSTPWIDFESGPFTDADKAVLAYAERGRAHQHGGRLTPALYARLRAHFSEADILELGVAMAVISGMAKLSFVLDLVEKEGYCPFAGGNADLRIEHRHRRQNGEGRLAPASARPQRLRRRYQPNFIPTCSP